MSGACAGRWETAEAGWSEWRGCRGNRSLCWYDDRAVCACAVEHKGLDLCSRCDEFPCRTYLDWIGRDAHHHAAFEWLRSMREQG